MRILTLKQAAAKMNKPRLKEKDDLIYVLLERIKKLNLSAVSSLAIFVTWNQAAILQGVLALIQHPTR